MKDVTYYMDLNYTIVINPIDETDGGRYYQLTIPDLPGFKIYEDTVADLMANLEAAKSAWFAVNLAEHRPISEPTPANAYSGRVTLRLPKSLHEQLSLMADREGISLNSQINHLLTMNAMQVLMTQVRTLSTSQQQKRIS